MDWIETIKICPSELRFAPDKTTELCELAVSTDPFAIQFVPEQTVELCWLALKLCPTVIIHIRKPTIEMIEYAVSYQGTLIRYFNNVPMKLLIDNFGSLNSYQFNRLLDYLKSIDIDEYIDIVKTRPQLAEACGIWTDDVIYAMLQENADNIIYVHKPEKWAIDMVMGKTKYILFRVKPDRTFGYDYEEVCWETIKKWPGVIADVVSPTHDMLESVIAKVPQMLSTHYSEDLAWIALNHDPTSIRFIKQATREMIEFVTDKCPEALRNYNGEIPKDLFEIAADKVPELLLLRCINVSEEEKWRCLKTDPFLIQLIHDASYEMQEYAVKTNPDTLKHTKMSEELCLIAIKQKPENISMIPQSKLTENVVKYALKKWAESLKYVNQTPERIEYALSHHGKAVFDFISSPRIKLRYMKSC